MTVKRAVYASALAGGIGLAGLFGVGVGTASAEPGPPCNAPGAPRCGDQHDNRGQAPADWSHRGIDQARGDHQPFNWHGEQVRPVPAGNGQGWGFWFLNQWIPL